MAGIYALTWSCYSVLNRRFIHVPSDTVGGFCLATALLATLCHLMFEATTFSQSTLQWLAVFGLGSLPVGAAFFVWDYGTKHGNIQVLGAFAFATPLISTLVLISAGKGKASWNLAAACFMIVGSAVIASKDMLLKIFRTNRLQQ